MTAPPSSNPARPDHNLLSESIADERRLLVLDGVHNFRDLGGYPAAGGGRTRWGLVYRADGLHHLTQGDVVTLRDRGLGMVIDLRTDLEISERGRYPVDQHAVRFHHLPVQDRTWMPGEVPEFDTAHEFLMWAYRDMLAVGAAKLAAGLMIIAEAQNTPLVFHCAAGKDRTGLLAALLLASLDVPADYIAADYGKTAEGMVRMRASWAAWAAEQGPQQVEQLNEDRSHYFESPAAVMTELLAELAATHGSVIDYVQSIGITDATIDALRIRLVEPAD
ncbi:MAG: tyrosine-protein phosphatase [Ilumatobacteraceae bacterium]